MGAAERCRHFHHNGTHDNQDKSEAAKEKELKSLKSENGRLRCLLEQNLKLLHDISESPTVLNSCPPELYAGLVATVDSKDFLIRLKSLHEAKTKLEFPFKEATGNMHSAEILINVDHEEPSWWVWVTDEMVPSNVEEWSGIDDENYIIVSEEHVVDGVANSMAKCILSNPKEFDPRRVAKKLYRSRAVLKLAAVGVQTTSKVVLRAL